jgi:cell division protein ZapA
MIAGKSKAESSEQTIRVEIYNQNYSIRSDGDNEYIMDLADYVDGKMREIASGTLTVDSLKVAILAALHIADEYHQLKMHQQQSTCSSRHAAPSAPRCSIVSSKIARSSRRKNSK